MHCRCEHWHLSCNVVDDDFVVDVWLHLKRWLVQSLYICQTFRLAHIVHSLALHPQLQQTQHGTMWKFPSLSPWWPKSTQLHWNRPSSCSVHSAMTQSQHPFDFLHFLDDITQKVEIIEKEPYLPPNTYSFQRSTVKYCANSFMNSPAIIKTCCCCSRGPSKWVFILYSMTFSRINYAKTN